MALYLKDATFLDWRTLEVKECHLKVEEGAEGGLSFPPSVLAGPGSKDRIMDCKGKLVTKSFGCGHHHIYSTLARGMPAPAKVPQNFTEILEYVWWHLDKRLDRAMIESSALAAAIHCAKNGVTFVIDHHASPFAAAGALHTVAEAFDRVGISHMLCYELSDRDGEASTKEALEETDSFLAGGRQGHVGLHASFTVGDGLLKTAIRLAQKHNTGVHVHVAEDMADQKHCQETYGMRVIERYAKAGLLELPDSILCHCLFLDENEKKLLKGSGVWVAECVESNLNNNVGATGYDWIMDRVMLGTDGLHSDMIRSAKAAFLVGQSLEGIGYDAVYERFRAVHRYAAQAGAKGDGDNNLVIMDYDSPTELTSDNFYGHFLFGLEPRHVQSVIARGRVIVENRKVTGVDEAEVLAEAKARGKLLWEKMGRPV